MLIFLLLAGAFFFVGQHVVHAQVDTGLNFATEIGLGDQDPRLTAARIIRALLGLLGVIAVGLILYSGWVWMTSQGNEEKIDKAKKLLRNTVIGLVIILAAFAIASFIINRLLEATGATGGSGGGVCTPSCSAGQYCCSGSCQSTPCSLGGSTPFQVRGNAPADGANNLPRNTVIRYRFNEAVRASSVDATTFAVFEEPAHTPVSGTRTVNGNYIEFVPNALCPAPHDTLHCFTANARIVVTAADNTILSTSGRRLDCSVSNKCEINVTMGNYVDTQAPRVNISATQVCAAPNNTVEASATDDYGISKIDFYLEGSLFDSVINATPPPLTPFNASSLWNGSPYSIGQNVTLKATAYDFDSNEASVQKQVRISAGHCCNGLQDGDETGVDCGGSCLACNGGACAPDINAPGVCSDAMCSSDFCTANGSTAADCEAAGFPRGTTSCCLCQSKPKITGVSPLGGFCSNDRNRACRASTEETDCGTGNTCNTAIPNGDTGNFITINGSGFGTARGHVYFTGTGGRPAEAKLADDPVEGNALCGTNTWTNNQIIAIIPAGAVDGVITVENSSGARDVTNDAFGSLINDFQKNTIERPGLCTVTPNAGRLNDPVAYQGIKLTSGEAYFGSLSEYVKALSSTFTVAKNGTAEVPNLTTGLTSTYILKSNVNSNFLNFTKTAEPVSGPVISSIEPLTGPVGQYITIRGSGFGNDRGTSSVHFDTATGPEADYNFPEVCAQTVWTDHQIIIKVPAGISVGRYSLSISRTGFTPVDSGNQKFEVVTGSPDPGLCRIDPTLGQPNSTVVFWGEYFRAQDSNSAVRFYNNHIQTGATLSYWDIDRSAAGAIKPWKVVTTVPSAATSGPLRVEVGSPAQVSNSVNFTVGTCSRDADCGPTATCCAAGLPEAGRCKANAGDCYGAVATSVFEWQFSTGYESLSCQPDQTQCGSVCCAGGCDTADPSKCARCASGQNSCGDGSCCNGPCIPGVGGGPSTCAASCSGYVYNQCIEGYFCPNSPGQCSPSAGAGSQVVTGSCDNGVCNSLAGCSGGSCQYNTTLNRCVQTSSLTANCSAKDLKDQDGNPITSNGNPVEGQCVAFRGDVHWQISWATSCPTGWSRGTGNTCVDLSDINGGCSVCGNGASCTMNGNRGVCAVGNAVCTGGATCDPVDQKCKKTDTGTCECCCRISNAAQDCCAGLTCGGSCGTGPGLGYCSGCVVGGVPDDDLCNCSGHDGKICDASVDPRGRCLDCSAITDPTECSKHARCCVDGRGGQNKCVSVTSGQPVVPEVVGGDTWNFCGFYKCTGAYPNSCNPLAVKDGPYKTTQACDQACVDAPVPCGTGNNCSIGPTCPTGMTCNLNGSGSGCFCKPDGGAAGDPCADPSNPLACILTGGCTAGYTCLAEPGDTCRCCCKPPVGGAPDSCKDIDPSLSCLANQGLCSGGDRGLCCGCTKDSVCGDVNTIGCGLTGSRCCSSRPTITDHFPAVDSTNICRNTVVEAVFDQKMDKTTFSINDNVQLIGDYGTDPCPSGYPIVASAEPTTRLAKLMYNFKKAVVKVAPFLITRPTFAVMSNFCVVSGNPIGSEVSGTKSKVSFRLQRPLDANHRYYVVLKGDPALGGVGIGVAKDYYNANITNLAKIGMIGVARGRTPTLFNHTEFKNAEIWSFQTGNDICLLDNVQVAPNFHLFQKTGQELFLNAYARARNGQSIQGISSVYEWSWAWKSDNDSIARVDQQADPAVALATAGNAKDAQTLGKATATITADTINPTSTRGQVTSGVAQLRLFLCENPWPVYFAIPGYVWPWKDDATGVEFYYCRDQAGVGTSDDLPALQEDPLVGPAARRICMFGANSGKSCRADSDCVGATGSCLPEVLKEFFFFREQTAGVPTLSGAIEPEGKKVTVSWNTTALAAKYKVYYGLRSRGYTSSVEVPAVGSGTITKTISGLVNGLNYYFAVTALTDKNQETTFSNEIQLKPTDTVPTDKPSIMGSGGDTKIGLFWSPVPEAVNYMAYLGVQSRGTDESYVYPVSKIVRSIPPVNTPNVTFNGLDNNATYYLAVKAIDAYGNLSPYSAEISVRPNTPYLVSAIPGTGKADLVWLPFVGAQGYTIKYTSTTLRDPVMIDVNGSTFRRTISNLDSGVTYTFSIIAKRANGSLSESSNSRTLRVR